MTEGNFNALMQQMQSFMEELSRHTSDSADKHAKIMDELNQFKVDRADFQSEMKTRVGSIDKTIGRIGDKVDATAERTEVIASGLETQQNHNSNQFDRLEALEKQTAVHEERLASKTKSKDDNTRLYVAAALFSLVLVMIAFGAMSVEEAKGILK